MLIYTVFILVPFLLLSLQLHFQHQYYCLFWNHTLGKWIPKALSIIISIQQWQPCLWSCDPFVNAKKCWTQIQEFGQHEDSQWPSIGKYPDYWQGHEKLCFVLSKKYLYCQNLYVVIIMLLTTFLFHKNGGLNVASKLWFSCLQELHQGMLGPSI